MSWAQCTECGETFSSDWNFDLHRAGSHKDDTRHCLNPAEVGLVRNRYNRWSLPDTEGRFLQGGSISKPRRPGKRVTGRVRHGAPVSVGSGEAL